MNTCIYGSTVVFAAIVLAMVAVHVRAAEMTGGTYAVEVSALTMGGGKAADVGTQYVLWDSLVPGTSGGRSGGGTYVAYAAVYTPLVPEPAMAAAWACTAYMLVRRRW